MKPKKNNKKKLLIILGIIILLMLGIVLYFVFRDKEENYSLNLSEKRWIDSNKNRVIDIGMSNDIPIFAMDGKGLLLTFFDYFEQSTGLELNKISSGSIDTANYSFKILDDSEKLKNNQILIYEDNFVLLGKEGDKISNFNVLTNRKIGVLKDDLSEISEYLDTNVPLNFVSIDSSTTLFSKFDAKELDYIAVPKNQYLDKIISGNYFVVYNMSALYNRYVLELNGSADLNSILTKKFKEWFNINFSKLYIEEMNDYYFKLGDIDEKKKNDFRGRIYIYGYVDNSPYDVEKTGKHAGINDEFMTGFEEFSGAKINYKKYNSVEALEDAFNKKNVDIMFNYYSFKGLKNSINTIPVYSSNYVILSHIDNNIAVDSFSSLKDKEIYAIKDTELANYINKNSGAKVKTYNKINNLLKNKEPLILLDLNVYNYYKSSKLKDYYIIYEGVADIKYNYVINTEGVNNTLFQIFQFYLTNTNHKKTINQGMSKLIKSSFLEGVSSIQYILVAGVILILLYFVLKRKKDTNKLKDGKGKYIDHLTSLKNRNYLIDNIDMWDEAKILPKTVIIVDLNRLKDVNNNFGYKEGDRLIKAASNILITTQPENTEIIRTDGNEFTIYMVGYEKAYVVEYTKKLNRILKELPYEHGATLGYSMITDDIKELEDAINEATLDMLTNKENRYTDM